MIAWLVLVMDLTFSAVYEEPHHHHKIKEVHHKIHHHNKSCRHHTHEEGDGSDLRLREEMKELTHEDPKPVPAHNRQ